MAVRPRIKSGAVIYVITVIRVRRDVTLDRKISPNGLYSSSHVARMKRSGIREEAPHLIFPTRIPGFRPGGLHPGYELIGRGSGSLALDARLGIK